MGAYLLICKGKTAEEAWSFFDKLEPPFRPFRDAIYGECTYECTVN
jgi:cell division cycle 14